MAQTDLFRKGKSLFSTTLQSSISTGTGDTITLSSAAGLPTDTEITLTFDRVDSNGTATPSSLERITGTISGNNLTSYTRGVDSTTEQSHDAGAVIEYVFNADDLNDIVDGITAEHNQDGTHKKVTGMNNDQYITGNNNAGSGEINIIKVNTSDKLQLGAEVAEFSLVNGANLQYNSADPWRSVTLPSAAWNPTTTSGCATITTVEAGTNDIDYQVLDFDASSDENAFCNFQMPDSYDGGVIQFRIIWTNAGGGSAETVNFALSGRSYADDGAIDQAVGTAVAVSDTWLAQGDIHISAWSGNVTLAGSPAGGQWVHLEIMRDTSEDDLTGDARLIGVQVRYKQGTYGD